MAWNKWLKKLYGFLFHAYFNNFFTRMSLFRVVWAQTFFSCGAFSSTFLGIIIKTTGQTRPLWTWQTFSHWWLMTSPKPNLVTIWSRYCPLENLSLSTKYTPWFYVCVRYAHMYKLFCVADDIFVVVREAHYIPLFN